MKRTKHQPLIKYSEALVFFGSWLLYAEFLKNGKGNIYIYIYIYIYIATVATQRRPDLQESTAKQNSAVCILGVNKIAPKFVTPVATYIYVVRLFKDLTTRNIYIYIYIYIYMLFGG